MGIFTARHELMGTVVEVRLDARDERAAAAADDAVVAEIERLTSVFSTWDPDSELCRWRDERLAEPGPELAAVLGDAHRWQGLSAGAFHPALGGVRKAWLAAQDSGRLPDRHALAAMTTVELPFTEDGRRTGDCAGVDLNAIAKGWIADRACELATAVPGVTSVLVNAGGDLVRRGAGTVRVGIEDPERPYDNVSPVEFIRLGRAALATSGLARRGFRVGRRWFGHVIDPRTGWPVEHTRSVSVVAPDCASADAIATVVGVLPLEEAFAFAEGQRAAALVFTADGIVRNEAWRRLSDG